MTAPDDAVPRERELRAIITRLEARIAELEAENARLRVELAKAGRDSSNSSKPPSLSTRTSGSPDHRPQVRSPPRY